MNATTTIVLDTETGGLEREHPTIQLAAIAVRGWQEIDRFERKIRFDEAQADPEALRINGYDADTWAREATDPPLVLREFGDWVSGYREVRKVSRRTGNPYSVARVAGWNVRFDCERIERGFKGLGLFLPAATFEALDVMQAARAHFWDRPGPENVKLPTVAAFLGIDTSEAHDALADCRITLAVARRIMACEAT